jgi:hypothetical protein
MKGRFSIGRKLGYLRKSGSISNVAQSTQRCGAYEIIWVAAKQCEEFGYCASFFASAKDQANLCAFRGTAVRDLAKKLLFVFVRINIDRCSAFAADGRGMSDFVPAKRAKGEHTDLLWRQKQIWLPASGTRFNSQEAYRRGILSDGSLRLPNKEAFCQESSAFPNGWGSG